VKFVATKKVFTPLIPEYLPEFSKKFETAPREYSLARGTLIHEKTRSRKSRVRLPLNASLTAAKGKLYHNSLYNKYLNKTYLHGVVAILCLLYAG
jgi:hypothetical protein